MSVILAIKPKFANKIFSGEKTDELRKRIWAKNNINKVYMYATSPISKIVGYFIINKIQQFNTRILWLLVKESACISKTQFAEYYLGKSHGYKISIKKAMKFLKPFDPKEINPDFKAPQNFMYVKKELERELVKLEAMN